MEEHSLVGDPAPGSNFAQVNQFYPFEKVSDRSRAYLDAAFEHLMMWADYVAPFKFHPDQVTHFALRPHYTLARACLESASQTVWMLATTDPMECVRRHLALIRWDLHEYSISRADPAAKERVRQSEKELLERVAKVFTQADIKPPGGYLHVLQAACKQESALKLSGADVERIWRAASGSAHGKYWPKLDLQTVIPGEEYEPGQFRALMLPDPGGIAEALEAAYRMMEIGALRHAEWSGADIARLLSESRVWLAGQITLRPDADPEVVKRMSRPVEDE